MSQELPNPFEAPATLDADPPTLDLLGRYGGIGRLVYFVGSCAVAIVFNGVLSYVAYARADKVAAIEPEASLDVVQIVSNILYLGGVLYLCALRMKNCGYSQLWCLGILVPLLNILVAVRAIACPEGYADHHKLDTAGKILIGLSLLAFVAVIGMTILSIFSI